MRTLLTLPLLAVPLLLAGCGQATPTNVEGAVTLNGKDVAEGFITFFPTDGVKATGKSEIRQGKYKVVNLPAGPRRVLITLAPKAEIFNSQDGEKRVKVTRDNSLTPESKGNNQVVEITGQDQVLDFHLQEVKR